MSPNEQLKVVVVGSGFGGIAARETGKQTIRSLETFESMT